MRSYRNDSAEGLTRAQHDAVKHIERLALGERAGAGADLRKAMEAQSISDDDYRRALDRLQDQGRVVLGFHPDRLSRSGSTVVEGLLADGAYKNQFETGVSSGSTSGFAGGRRDEWERQLFGGVYHQRGTTWGERPTYGALFLVAHPDGPCPRFGSCYFVLRPEVSSRSTFTLLGSQEDGAAELSGTLDVFEPVMAALSRHLETVPEPLGCKGLTLHRLLSQMGSALPIVPEGGSPGRLGRALDSFVEAQVHGPVDLERDVEELVVDASFRETNVAESLAELAAAHGIRLRWHPGFTLAPEDFPEEFRGFMTRRIAKRVAVEGIVDAPSLGAGENDFVLNPESWQELGSRSAILTSFRRVWHVLVLMGMPSSKWRDVSTS